MNSPNKMLNELMPGFQDYKVNVKIIERFCPEDSAKENALHEALLLQDVQGNKMWADLYEGQVESFKDNLKNNHKYTIVSAPILMGSRHTRSYDSGNPYEMVFNEDTVIEPMDENLYKGFPDYMCIAHVPMAGCFGRKFDLLGIILYIEPKARLIETALNHKLMVKEIVVTDYSCPRPLLLVTSIDLADQATGATEDAVQLFSVVGFMALKTSTYQGFSMVSTKRTEIHITPPGTAAAELQKWAFQNKSILTKRRHAVIFARNTFQRYHGSTIAELQLKKDDDALQFERHWLKITRVDADFSSLTAYIGCVNCNSLTNTALNKSSTCIQCRTPKSLASHRIMFRCPIYDDTGRLQVTMLTEDTATLFGMTAADIFRLKRTHNRSAFEVIQAKLQDTLILIKVAPRSILSTHGVLQWGVKQVQPRVEGTSLQEASTKSIERALPSSSKGNKYASSSRETQALQPFHLPFYLHA